ncbi:hypothetical protein ACEQPO_26515 [Bacillus sp. SL00103]
MPFIQEVQSVAEINKPFKSKQHQGRIFVKPDGLQHAEELKASSIGPGQFNSYVSPASAGSYEYLLSFLEKEESVLKQKCKR